MNNYKYVECVPWFNLAEWKQVMTLLHSSNESDLKRAYKAILIWKHRRPSLPTYVECTLGILQVYMEKLSLPVDCLMETEIALRLKYSTAITRFINHVSALSGTKNNLYIAAKSQNIPDWMVNLRHEAAHGQNLPSLDLFEMAADFAFRWLLDNYWAVEEKNMGKFFIEKQSSCRDTIIYSIIKVWKEISEETVEWLFDLSGPNWKQLKKLCNNNEIQRHAPFLATTQPLLKLKSFIKKTKISRQEGKESRKATAKIKVVLKILIKLLKLSLPQNNQGIILLIDALFINDFLSGSWKQWRDVMLLLYKNKGLSRLIEKLIKENSESASIWLLTLAQVLSNKKDFGIERNIEQDIQIDAFRGMFFDPNEKSKEILLAYLKLLQPQLSSAQRQLIEVLLKIHVPDYFNEEELDIPGKNMTYDFDIYAVTDLNNNWKKSIIDQWKWKDCPIGLIPGQQTDPNELSICDTIIWKTI